MFSGWLDGLGKLEQEKNSLTLSGDFFQKIIVENGYRDFRPDADGIFRVGVIPFLLDSSILDGIIKEAKSSPRKRWLPHNPHHSPRPAKRAWRNC